MPLRKCHPLTRRLALAMTLFGVSSVAFGQTNTVNVPATQPAVDDSATPSGAASPVASTTAAPSPGNFFQRFAKAYADDWKATPSTDAGPKFRGTPSPVDGPPFPFSDWPYGGSVVISKPWTQSSPLMQAIWSGSNGEGWKKSGVQIYGWTNFGFNISTSDKPGYANLPAAYAERPNSIQPDQQVLYIERQPDTVQTDHFDWGFRVAQLYGMDYRFTTAKGVFSEQLLKHNREYGYDPVMVYADLYFPHVAQGMDVRIGRYISLPDIEAQLAPNNYTYSHSLTYTYDCYTKAASTPQRRFRITGFSKPDCLQDAKLCPGRAPTRSRHSTHVSRTHGRPAATMFISVPIPSTTASTPTTISPPII